MDAQQMTSEQLIKFLRSTLPQPGEAMSQTRMKQREGAIRELAKREANRPVPAPR